MLALKTEITKKLVCLPTVFSDLKNKTRPMLNCKRNERNRERPAVNKGGKE